MWRRGDMVKFHCTAHDHNNSMSCIPAELYEKGVGGINWTRDSRSVSFASDAFVRVWPKSNVRVCGLECCLDHCQTTRWQCDSQTDPLALFVCVRYVVQEGMSCTSWAAGRRISRLSIIMVRGDLHPVETTGLSYVWIIYIQTIWW